MADRNYYDELEALRIAYPALTYDNEGYDNIADDVRAANADGQAAIETILKETVQGFIRFQNFKPRKNGSFAVRCQTQWSPHFVGVTYIPMADFRPGNPALEEA